MPDPALAINLEAETSLDAGFHADLKAAVAASLNLARTLTMKEGLDAALVDAVVAEASVAEISLHETVMETMKDDLDVALRDAVETLEEHLHRDLVVRACVLELCHLACLGSAAALRNACVCLCASFVCEMRASGHGPDRAMAGREAGEFIGGLCALGLA